MHALGNLFKHYFGRAAANGVDACIPCHAFNDTLLHEAHAAMKLQAGVHDFINEFATVRLHHRDFFGCFDSARMQPGRMESKPPSSSTLAASIAKR